MNKQSLLEERHLLLKGSLDEKMRKKRALELEISKQFEELKKLEISLEKRADLTRALRLHSRIDMTQHVGGMHWRLQVIDGVMV